MGNKGHLETEHFPQTRERDVKHTHLLIIFFLWSGYWVLCDPLELDYSSTLNKEAVWFFLQASQTSANCPKWEDKLQILMNKHFARLAISKQEMFAFIYLIYQTKNGNEDGKARYQNDGIEGFLP